MSPSPLFPWDSLVVGPTKIPHEEDIFSISFQNRSWTRVVYLIHFYYITRGGKKMKRIAYLGVVLLVIGALLSSFSSPAAAAAKTITLNYSSENPYELK